MGRHDSAKEPGWPAKPEGVFSLAADGRAVLARVRRARGAWGRARGLLGRPPPAPGEGLALIPCGAVHTWGMRYALDVLFFDRAGRVTRVVRNLPPWRMAAGGPGAWGCIETVAGGLPPDAPAEGALLTWSPPPAGAQE